MERSKKTTDEQKEALLDYMEMHLEFACDRFESADVASLRHERWKELAQKLNSVGGPVKDRQKLKKFWTDQKLHVKERQALLNASINKSGINGMKIVKPLSAFESRISALLMPTAVSGNEDVREVFATTTTRDTEPEYLMKEYLDEELEEVQHTESGTTKRNNTSESSTAPKVAMIRKRKRAPSGRSYINNDFEVQFSEVERRKLELNIKRYELELEKFQWQKTKENKELELRERELEIRKMQLNLCP